MPWLVGEYLYADFCSGQLRGIYDPAGLALDIDHSDSFIGATGAIRFVADFCRDADGEIYAAEHYSARLWKLVPRVGFDRYCASTPNSSGAAAALTLTGSANLSDADLTLTTVGLPPFQFGLFLMSEDRALSAPFVGSQGQLCVAGTIYRWAATLSNAGPMGVATHTTDFSDLPGVTFQAGDTWHFQHWTRDVNPTQTSNTSDAASVTFGL